MHLGTEYRLTWEIEADLDEYGSSGVATAYLDRIEDAVDSLGLDHTDGLAEVRHDDGREEAWHDTDEVLDEDYDDLVLEDLDVRYGLEDGGFVRFQYDPGADGGDFCLRAGGGPRVRHHLRYELGKDPEPTLAGTVRELLGG
jgi:hypothetical protein